MSEYTFLILLNHIIESIDCLEYSIEYCINSNHHIFIGFRIDSICRLRHVIDVHWFWLIIEFHYLLNTYNYYNLSI